MAYDFNSCMEDKLGYLKAKNNDLYLKENGCSVLDIRTSAV